jgi:Na+-translocating ferredoxin:NAD+ oxidoreductase RnfD subunit
VRKAEVFSMVIDLFTLIGVVGTAVVVTAYFATQQRWIAAEDWQFPLANLIGSIMMLISLITAWNLPAALIEVFWIAISVYGLVRNSSAPTEIR